MQAQALPSGSLPEEAKMSQLAGPESEWLVTFQAGATQTQRRSRGSHADGLTSGQEIPH